MHVTSILCSGTSGYYVWICMYITSMYITSLGSFLSLICYSCYYCNWNVTQYLINKQTYIVDDLSLLVAAGALHDLWGRPWPAHRPPRLSAPPVHPPSPQPPASSLRRCPSRHPRSAASRHRRLHAQVGGAFDVRHSALGSDFKSGTRRFLNAE